MIQAAWIEVPVKDMRRAIQFYRTVFDLHTLGPSYRKREMALLVSDNEDLGFTLRRENPCHASDTGLLVYLETHEELCEHLRRVESAGGKVLTPKSAVGSAGNYATFLDTEGNLLALCAYN